MVIGRAFVPGFVSTVLVTLALAVVGLYPPIFVGVVLKVHGTGTVGGAAGARVTWTGSAANVVAIGVVVKRIC